MKDELKHRREELVERLGDNALVILFSGDEVRKSADELYPFTANRNFFYVTGLNRPRMACVLRKRAGELSEFLFLEPVNPHEEKWTGKMLTHEEARETSGIHDLHDYANLRTRLPGLLASEPVVWLDFDRRQWDSSPSFAERFSADLTSRYPGLSVRNVHDILTSQRTRKSDHEVALIREAIGITKVAVEAMLGASRPGVLESELEANFDYVLTMNGATTAFSSIIAGGAAATVLHYVANNATVEDGALILADVGAERSAYKADITRTFPVNGRFTARQRELYDLVLAAHQAVIAHIRPGIAHRELQETAKSVLADGLKRLGVIREDAELGDYYYHGVSHSLGLDTHDEGDCSTLQPGMVLTVEPGLYLAAEGIGIRIEDDVLVTESGSEVLSSDIPRTADEVEQWMASARAQAQA